MSRDDDRLRADDDLLHQHDVDELHGRRIATDGRPVLNLVENGGEWSTAPISSIWDPSPDDLDLDGPLPDWRWRP